MCRYCMNFYYKQWTSGHINAPTVTASNFKFKENNDTFWKKDLNFADITIYMKKLTKNYIKLYY